MKSTQAGGSFTNQNSCPLAASSVRVGAAAGPSLSSTAYELRVYNCIHWQVACMGRWHFTCLTEEDRHWQSLPSDLIENAEDRDGVAAPPWRCKDCAKTTKYAVQRILEILRDEEGRSYFVLEYPGYRLSTC